MNIKILLYCSFFVLVSGCKKQLDKYTQFDMSYNETVVIPSSSGVNLPFNINSPTVETNAASTFAVNDTRKDLIEEIHLTELKLTITSPSSSDFSYLESIEVYLSAAGLSEIKMAWSENVPSASNSFTLEISDTDLQEYIKKDEIDLRFRTVTDEFITSDQHIRVDASFHVNAKIFGQ